MAIFQRKILKKFNIKEIIQEMPKKCKFYVKIITFLEILIEI
jgi:hypothetical protein